VYLTRRQHEILGFLKNYISKHGYSPTFQEIAEHFKFSSKGTVYKHLLNLKEKGFIKKCWNKSRSIELTSDIAEMAIVKLPLLGYVKAGQPIEAITEYNTIAVPSDLVRKGRHYVLRVKGDSMIEEHIRDGDFVIVKEQQAAENGEVVIALVRGTEVTIKNFYRENEYIRLQPANANLEPLILQEESVAIQGVVVGILRKFI